MKNKEKVMKWITRAKSNLILAGVGKISDGLAYEELCFECQQAAEKAIKAILISLDVHFPYTHNITKLIELVIEQNITVPKEIAKATSLTDYATTTRYPDEFPSVTEENYRLALALAANVVDWAEQVIIEIDES